MADRRPNLHEDVALYETGLWDNECVDYRVCLVPPCINNIWCLCGQHAAEYFQQGSRSTVQRS